jgi:hypothetical protein
MLYWWLRSWNAPDVWLNFSLHVYQKLLRKVYCMAEPKCKTDHAALTSRYCPECAAELNDPEAEKVAGIFESRVVKVLESYGFKKKPDKPAEDEGNGEAGEKPPKSKVSRLFKRGGK